tara:strand:- start:503 stop:667 length:165 start_codon:yes stop_codon:yes gene_type:complete
MVVWGIAGCITSNVTRPGLVEPGQKVDPLNQIKFLMTGKKEAEAIKNNYIFIVL